mgnify:CR=1 FL=1
MTGVRTVEVSSVEAETRLDRWFARHFPDLSHGLVQKLLRTGQVRVDGARASGNLRLSAGQHIRIPPMVESGPRLQGASSRIDCEDARTLRSRILYENHELIVIDKPDRKSTRLNSSHALISYAVFCLKKKNRKKKKKTLCHHLPHLSSS